MDSFVFSEDGFSHVSLDEVMAPGKTLSQEQLASLKKYDISNILIEMLGHQNGLVLDLCLFVQGKNAWWEVELFQGTKSNAFMAVPYDQNVASFSDIESFSGLTVGHELQDLAHKLFKSIKSTAQQLMVEEVEVGV